MAKSLHEKAAELTFEQCMEIVKSTPVKIAAKKK
jgi:DNA topoisomerase-1